MVIPPWSFSTISSYETCPFKYYAAKVSRKFPDSQGEASIWGNRVHSALEARLKTKTYLPEGMQQWEPLAKLFDDPGGKLLVEHKFALDKQFRPTAWGAAWVRGIIDVGVLKLKNARAYDWKTGKVKPDSGQLKLSAAALMHTYPYLESTTTGFVWLQDGSMTEATYTRDDLPAIWAEFLPKVARWENSYNTDKWEKRPSGLCGQWCSNLECGFNGRRKIKDEDEDETAGLEAISGTPPGRGTDPVRDE